MQYNNGIPEGSRFNVEQEQQFQDKAKWLSSPEGQQQIELVRKISEFAEKGPYLPFSVTPSVLLHAHQISHRAAMQGFTPRTCMGSAQPEHLDRHPRGIKARAGS